MEPDSDIILTTDRIALRRFIPEDADLLFALDSDSDVMQFISHTSPSRDEIATDVLPRILAQYARGPLAGTFAAHDRETRDFIGWFELDGSPHEPELGYRLKRSCWGRGLATEGSRALIDIAFRNGQAERIWAQTMAINTGSRRVMEKCGLRHIRTFHEHFDDPLPGTEHGEVEYAITRAEWQASHMP